MTSAGNILFYDLFLGPLTSDAIEDATRDEIKQIVNLTPGDFKIVRDRYSFYPSENIDHNMLIGDLQKEAEIKIQHQGNKQIGF